MDNKFSRIFLPFLRRHYCSLHIWLLQRSADEQTVALSLYATSISDAGELARHRPHLLLADRSHSPPSDVRRLYYEGQLGLNRHCCRRDIHQLLLASDACAMALLYRALSKGSVGASWL